MACTMMRHVSRVERVLIVDPHADEIATAMRGLGVTADLRTCTDASTAAAELPLVDVLMTGPFPVELLRDACNLRWVQSLWAGVDTWARADVPEGLPVTRMTEVFGGRMGEYVLAHLLGDTQEVPRFAASQARAAWEPVATRTLRGQVAGVAGTGWIGSDVIRLLAGVGMDVRGLNRSGRPIEGTSRTYPASALRAFLAPLDVLVLVLPATSATTGLIGREALSWMRSDATLVNIGRGNVVDLDALVDALRDGRLRRAVLDTLPSEPLPSHSPLWHVPNLVLTPHIAGPGLAAEVAVVCARNLALFERGMLPPPLLDRARGY
jgi:glyoxylate/hydroxypyruvate reductase A